MGRRFFMNVKDRIELPGGDCCPPHRLPHTLPIIGEKIVDERCHFHKSVWRMTYHLPFCKILRCPHYEKMTEAYEQYLEKE